MPTFLQYVIFKLAISSLILVLVSYYGFMMFQRVLNQRIREQHEF
jgi:hypothetical protein